MLSTVYTVNAKKKEKGKKTPLGKSANKTLCNQQKEHFNMLSISFSLIFFRRKKLCSRYEYYQQKVKGLAAHNMYIFLSLSLSRTLC